MRAAALFLLLASLAIAAPIDSKSIDHGVMPHDTHDRPLVHCDARHPKCKALNHQGLLARKGFERHLGRDASIGTQDANDLVAKSAPSTDKSGHHDVTGRGPAHEKANEDSHGDGERGRHGKHHPLGQDYEVDGHVGIEHDRNRLGSQRHASKQAASSHGDAGKHHHTGRGLGEDGHRPDGGIVDADVDLDVGRLHGKPTHHHARSHHPQSDHGSHKTHGDIVNVDVHGKVEPGHSKRPHHHARSGSFHDTHHADHTPHGDIVDAAVDLELNGHRLDHSHSR